MLSDLMHSAPAFSRNLLDLVAGGDDDAAAVAHAAARHVLRHVDFRDEAQADASAAHLVRTLLDTAGDGTSLTVQARRIAARINARVEACATGRRAVDAAQFDLIENACERVVHGSPTLHTGDLIGDTWSAFVTAGQDTQITSPEGLAHTLARTVMHRRRTADDGMGTGGEDDARRGAKPGQPSYTQWLARLKKGTRRTAGDGSTYHEARHPFVALDATYDDGRQVTVPTELTVDDTAAIALTGEHLERVGHLFMTAIDLERPGGAWEAFTTAEITLIDSALGDTATHSDVRAVELMRVWLRMAARIADQFDWDMTTSARALMVIWDGIRQVTDGVGTSNPIPRWGTGMALHADTLAGPARLTVTDVRRLVRYLCGHDAVARRPATYDADGRLIRPARPGKPAMPGLFVLMRNELRAAASATALTPHTPTHAHLEYAA